MKLCTTCCTTNVLRVLQSTLPHTTSHPKRDVHVTCTSNTLKINFELNNQLDVENPLFL